MRIAHRSWRTWLSAVVCLCACSCALGRKSETADNGGLEALLHPKVAQSQSANGDAIEPTPPDPKNPADLSLAYATWMEEVGNLIEARRHYDKALNARHKSPEVALDATLGMARVADLSGRTEEADIDYEKALKMAPADPRVLDAVGQFYANHHRWTEAVSVFDKALAVAPAEKSYRYHLAVALVHVGQTDEALQHFARTVGDAESHYNVGLILQQEGKLADAEQQFLLAATKKPELHQAQSWLAEVRRRREQMVPATIASDDLGILPVSHEEPADPQPVVAARPLSSPAAAAATNRNAQAPRALPIPTMTAQQHEQLRNQRSL